MAKLSARRCETERPDKSGKDKLPGDGDGLLLRITPRGTKTWIIDYEFQSRRRKCKLGAFELAGGPDTDIGQWLTHGSLSPGQARSIAAQWKADRRAGRDPLHARQMQLSSRSRPNRTSQCWVAMANVGITRSLQSIAGGIQSRRQRQAMADLRLSRPSSRACRIE